MKILTPKTVPTVWNYLLNTVIIDNTYTDCIFITSGIFHQVCNTEEEIIKTSWDWDVQSSGQTLTSLGCVEILDPL